MNWSRFELRFIEASKTRTLLEHSKQFTWSNGGYLYIIDLDGLASVTTVGTNKCNLTNAGYFVRLAANILKYAYMHTKIGQLNTASRACYALAKIPAAGYTLTTSPTQNLSVAFTGGQSSR